MGPQLSFLIALKAKCLESKPGSGRGFWAKFPQPGERLCVDNRTALKGKSRSARLRTLLRRKPR